jgi:hypothetical protein
MQNSNTMNLSKIAVAAIALLMNIVGGRKTEELLREVLTEFNEWYELHKEDLA